jgi:hypothetical protein
MTRPPKDGFRILGVGAAACVACCAGPILAFLGGLSLAGLAGTWLLGSASLAIAAVAAIGFFIVRRRRQQSACATVPADPVPVQLTRQGASR